MVRTRSRHQPERGVRAAPDEQRVRLLVLPPVALGRSITTTICEEYKITPYPVFDETHYAVSRNNTILAYCHDRESAILVRDDDIRRRKNGNLTGRE